MFDGGPLPHEPIEPWRSFKQKLDRRAQLHDRLKALGAFTGIAVGAVAGFEMVIGGGFDFITPAPEVRQVAPSSYVTVHQVPWSSEMQVTPLSSTEPLFAGDFIQVETASEDLAGGYDDADAPDAPYLDVNEDRVRAEIAELYADTEPAYVEAGIAYEDARAIDEPQAEPDPYAEAEAMVEQALGSVKDAALQPS
jgi:hypothetical protein